MELQQQHYLTNFFNSINVSNEIYIPDRRKEGYGPTINAFQKLISSGVGLIYTVDCGTLSFEPIKYAKSKNIDVIVLDHHQSEIRLPEAFSVVNPNRIDDKSKLTIFMRSRCFVHVSCLFE